MNHETRRKIIKNNITPPEKIREKELHFELQEEEWLGSSNEILKKASQMNEIFDEPPCRTSMKNSGNKRMIKRKGKVEKNSRRSCQDQIFGY